MDQSGILGSNKGRYGQIRQLRANMQIRVIKPIQPNIGK